MTLVQVLITCSLSNASTSMKTELQRFRWEVLGFHSIRPLQLCNTKGLSNLVALSNLNLSNNYISRLCQLACLPNLHTLNIAKSVTGFSFQHNFSPKCFFLWSLAATNYERGTMSESSPTATPSQCSTSHIISWKSRRWQNATYILWCHSS